MENIHVVHRSTDTYKHSPVVTFFAKFFSYLFHPLFIPLYVGWYLVFIHHSYFAGFGEQARTWVMLRIVLNMVFFPAITVFLLKGVGFIESIFLKKQKDRIIPYMASGIFFFWMYLVFHNQPEIPKILTAFTFGVFLASSLALLANIYFKISMHAIGCGGMLGLMIVVLYDSATSPFTLPLIIAILITGIVCTSRLIVSDHSQNDIYLGLLVGFICQFISAAFQL
ncbi:MAG TPA: hypothetical protein VMY77_05535 [Chitinophagaceae bacterium]|nr:hypothetical protein [Chitinophagaceae bacterium]